jgi:hypothetical protein
MIAYFDCVSGISGDMFLGALIDAGLSVRKLSGAIESLGIRGLKLRAVKVTRLGIAATKADVVAPHEHAHRNLRDIERLIRKSALPPAVKSRSQAIFIRLARAEAKVHNCGLYDVHFHEVGALDSIADIVAAAAGIDMIGITDCRFSPVPVGSGTVKMAHGVLPVPAPATAELLIGVPLRESPETGELTTPTGAAIARELSSGFGPMPAMTVAAIGNGAGSREGRVVPNVLRVFIGGESADKTPRSVTVIETAIDNMTGEALAYAQETLFSAGALDVYFTPIFMKKNRPAHLLTVLVDDQDLDAVLETVFRETSTLGVRVARWGRETLDRESVQCSGKFGKFRAKVGRLGGRALSATPEFEDAREIARRTGKPFRHVYAALQAEASRLLSGKSAAGRKLRKP